MPYRIELRPVAEDVVDRLIDLGALDVDASHDVVTALMPDSISAAALADALEVDRITVSAARSRDGGSVWVLAPRPVRVGRVHIVPADAAADACALRLIDAGAFGTGLHPTTSLCLEILDDALHTAPADAVLDVGTGSGVLALAALKLGVPRATGIDVDDEALRVARKNARLNRLDARFQLIRGGPDAVDGRWPLVLANVLAAPLIEMAPVLVRRLGRHAQLVLSGIPASVEPDVDRVYRRLGLRRLRVLSRDGWVALVLQASW